MTVTKQTGLYPQLHNSNCKLHYNIYNHNNNPKPRATLLIIHGMQEHSGRYDEIARYFAQHDIAVMTYDHIGHGKSVARPEDLGFFQLIKPGEQLIADAITMSRKLHADFPKIPHFILGHSMGSFIVRCLLQQESSNFSGAIITGTGGKLKGLHLLYAYFAIANKVSSRHITWFNSAFTAANNRKFRKDTDYSSTSWLSANKTNREQFTQDELCGLPFTNNAFYALFSVYLKATRTNWADAIAKDFPMLFVSGQDDSIGNFGKSVTKTYSDLQSNGHRNTTLKLYANMRHEILNETINRQIYQQILEWMNI